MKVSCDRLILSLLISCSVPFAGMRAILANSVPQIEQSESITVHIRATGPLSERSKQVWRNSQIAPHNWQKISKLHQEPNGQASEREADKQLFRNDPLIAQSLEDAWQLFEQANEQIDRANVQEAIRLFNIARAMFKDHRDAYGETVTLISLSAVCIKLENCDQTLSYYQQAKVLVVEISSIRITTTLQHLLMEALAIFIKQRRITSKL